MSLSNKDISDRVVVVTGSTGLVGSHTVAELIRSGYRNIILPVRSASRISLLHKTLRREGIDLESSATYLHVFESSLNNPQTLGRLFSGVDVVFNCAAMVALGGVDQQELIHTNVEITQHIVDACLSSSVSRLVHVSSVAALGSPQDGETYSNELSIMESLVDASAYARSKFLSENEVMRGSYLGLKSVVVNPATIIGSGNWRSGSTAMIPLLARGLPIYTEGVTAWVDVRDVARAMVLLVDNERAIGERFALVAENLSFRELVTLSNRASGRRPPRIRAGSRMMGVAQSLEKFVANSQSRSPMLTDEIVSSVLSKHYYNGDKIKSFLSFDYTPLESSIKRVIEDYLNEKEEEEEEEGDE